LVDLGGRGLLSKYNNSFSLLLSSVYPEFKWLPWRFTVAPRKFWDDIGNQKEFLNWAGKELGIKDMSDWYIIGQKV
jgi:hypothetical protein